MGYIAYVCVYIYIYRYTHAYTYGTVLIDQKQYPLESNTGMLLLKKIFHRIMHMPPKNKSRIVLSPQFT